MAKSGFISEKEEDFAEKSACVRIEVENFIFLFYFGVGHEKGAILLLSSYLNGLFYVFICIL